MEAGESERFKSSENTERVSPLAMSTKTVCPYCFDLISDEAYRLERHVKASHNEANKLTLYTFGERCC